MAVLPAAWDCQEKPGQQRAHWWENEREREKKTNGGLTTKVGHFRLKKKASRRWKINSGRKMHDERREIGWKQQRGRVKRRRGLLTEYRGPWGDGWSESSGVAIHQTSRGGEKNCGDKHTPQKSELQRIWKMCGGLWKRGKKGLCSG